MGQADGFLGMVVDRMIRRNVCRSFHTVSWIPPKEPIKGPCILAPNHHGWHDGYIMYHVVAALGLRSHLWIEEFGAFPLFSKVGGMPFPPSDAAKRAATIRKTIRALSTDRSLVLFGEGKLHPPPTLLPFGRSLGFLARRLPKIPIYPVAIRYEMSVHERPECFASIGAPIESGERIEDRTRLTVGHLLDELTSKVRLGSDEFAMLVEGTPDVNERLDMRKIPQLR